MHINVIGRRKLFLGISVVAVGIALIAIGAFRFHEGIDFSGGTLWQFTVHTNTPDVGGVQQEFGRLGIQGVQVTYDATDGSFFARLPALSEADHQKFSGELETAYPSFDELGFQSIGPSVGAELRKNALIAIVLVLVGISLYIAFAFRRVYRPVSSWKYGWVTLITLFHDVSIPAGLLAILGRFAHIEIDSNFIVALLVVMGFSVHDTIVVFDRIRENLILDRGRKDFGDVVNESVNQTLARSVNTSFTLILVLLALYFTGPVNLHYFVLTLLVGVTTGIYSSIFVASPLLYIWHKFSSRKAKTK